jgi:hypothetical protein
LTPFRSFTYQVFLIGIIATLNIRCSVETAMLVDQNLKQEADKKEEKRKSTPQTFEDASAELQNKYEYDYSRKDRCYLRGWAPQFTETSSEIFLNCAAYSGDRFESQLQELDQRLLKLKDFEVDFQHLKNNNISRREIHNRYIDAIERAIQTLKFQTEQLKNARSKYYLIYKEVFSIENFTALRCTYGNSTPLDAEKKVIQDAYQLECSSLEEGLDQATHLDIVMKRFEASKKIRSLIPSSILSYQNRVGNEDIITEGTKKNLNEVLNRIGYEGANFENYLRQKFSITFRGISYNDYSAWSNALTSLVKNPRHVEIFSTYWFTGIDFDAIYLNPGQFRQNQITRIEATMKATEKWDAILDYIPKYFLPKSFQQKMSLAHKKLTDKQFKGNLFGFDLIYLKKNQVPLDDQILMNIGSAIHQFDILADAVSNLNASFIFNLKSLTLLSTNQVKIIEVNKITSRALDPKVTVYIGSDLEIGLNSFKDAEELKNLIIEAYKNRTTRETYGDY